MIDYYLGILPPTYVCGSCRRKGVKLWRNPGRTDPATDLRCLACLLPSTIYIFVDLLGNVQYRLQEATYAGATWVTTGAVYILDEQTFLPDVWIPALPKRGGYYTLNELTKLPIPIAQWITLPEF